MIIVLCPHCDGTVVVEQLNCQIFRHGVYKANGQQMNPHTPKEECDAAVEKERIYGCGKPFKVVLNEESKYTAIICDYI